MGGVVDAMAKCLKLITDHPQPAVTTYAGVKLHIGSLRQYPKAQKQAEYSLSTVYWNVVPLSRGKDL